MIQRLIAPAALVALAACTDPAPTDGVVASDPDAPATYAPERVPDGQAIAAVGDLLGEYRVAGINGEPLEMDHGIAVSIDGALLSFDPTCLGNVWTVEFEGELLRLRRYREPAAEVGPGEPPVPSRPVCAVAVPPQWSDLAIAFDAATRVERTPANAVRFSGGGKSVTLFSQ